MSSVKSKKIPSLDKSDEERFWSHVQRNGNGRGCWLWTGSCNSKGYGRFFVNGAHFYAHRLSWSLAGRTVPVDLSICHTCDNPRCVNPDHLIMADAATISQDAKWKRNLAGKRAKAKKPYPEFPLFPHATGRWAKKIRGKLHYFGPTIGDSDGETALNKYLDQKDDLHAGRTPRTSGDGLTIRDLLSRFLTAKRHLVDTKELTHRTFADYHATCVRLKDAFGPTRLVEDLASDDFEHLRAALAKTRGPVALGNEIQRIRTVFKYADDAGLIDRPVRYGPTFKRPSKKVLRRAQQENGERMFEVEQIRQLLDVAPVQLRAMILLGINCGLGNNDCGSLTQKHIDLDAGWLDYPRPKTGMKRRCPLWKQTIEAVRAAIDARPAAKDDGDADRVFLTRLGQRWTRDADINGGGKIAPKIDVVSQRFGKLLVDQGMARRGLGFYALRHTFETIAGDSTDQVAVDHVMGHVDASMAANHRHRIDDERLRKVVEHVRRWLFSPEMGGKKKAN